MTRAAHRLDPDEGMKKLESLAVCLERDDHADAAASLHDGKEESFTVNRLGRPSTLTGCHQQRDREPQPNRCVRIRTRRVPRWQERDGAPRVREELPPHHGSPPPVDPRSEAGGADRGTRSCGRGAGPRSSHGPPLPFNCTWGNADANATLAQRQLSPHPTQSTICATPSPLKTSLTGQCGISLWTHQQLA